MKIKNRASKMVPKFVASDHLKISQVQLISKCEGSSNLSIRMHAMVLCIDLKSQCVLGPTFVVFQSLSKIIHQQLG